LSKQSNRKRILLICGGNTCRSPMAKVILEQKLQALGSLDRFEIDSAAYDGPTYPVASDNAREAIKKLFGQDLLASHKAKKLTPELIERADLILVMKTKMKKGLPHGKTWTLKEYAGGSGDVADPFGSSLESYLKCAYEISDALEHIVTKLG
jgi:protein-tyrosine-phosphatase